MNHNQSTFLPMAALVGNALIWGLIWWPLKTLQEHGWHPLWSTALVFLLAAVGVGLHKPQSLSDLRASPLLWIVGIAAGVTNSAFNWGMAIGDVVRVILLFYLMPVWAIILARLVLKEPITMLALVRVGLALAGAAIVLEPEGGGIPLPATAGDWLGLVGGISFAATNVVLRRAAQCTREGRALAMFTGGVVIPAMVGVGLTATGTIGLPSSLGNGVLGLIIGVGVVMLAANGALQYAAVRLPVNVTAVIMLTEVVFAALSSVLLGGAVLSAPMIGGGALILIASGLSVLGRKSVAKSH